MNVRTSLIAITLALTSLVSAQFGTVALASVPQCAQNCLASNIGAADQCGTTDYACFCKSAGYINAVSCCLQNACNATEQKTAITFNVALCNNFNVTVPNYLACSSSQPVSYNLSSISFPSTIAVTALASVTTIDSYIPAYVTTSGGPVASFNGPPLLTGTCTTARFASYTDAVGMVTQFPYIGCQNSGCCPFNPGNPGPLTICPHDYFTTSGACCPSGWALAKKAMAGGLTYCETSPAELLVPATTAQSGHAAVISEMLYTLKYDLGEAVPTGLSSGAIAGIAVGSVLGILFLGLAGLLAYRARQRHAQKIRNATVPAPTGTNAEHGEFLTGMKEQLTPITGLASPHIVEAPTSNDMASELPSPPIRGSGDVYRSAPSSAVGTTGFMTPQELPGSFHMHEHHPAMQAQGEQAELDGQEIVYEDDLYEDEPHSDEAGNEGSEEEDEEEEEEDEILEFGDHRGRGQYSFLSERGRAIPNGSQAQGDSSVHEPSHVQDNRTPNTPRDMSDFYHEENTSAARNSRT